MGILGRISLMGSFLFYFTPFAVDIVKRGLGPTNSIRDIFNLGFALWVLIPLLAYSGLAWLYSKDGKRNGWKTMSDIALHLYLWLWLALMIAVGGVDSFNTSLFVLGLLALVLLIIAFVLDSLSRKTV